ncbi:MAG: thymidine phosphorylase [Oscillospiraceae bacterium]
MKADKHSTGGVGDKTSLILCPMVAACGLKIAKMSGRGLGHTGGTIDKLESFPGYHTGISDERFIENVNRVGIAITSPTADIDPADKKLYALRDVTGTVPSIPLIVSSIMSKKLAAGADVIVLDVKCGGGAFMKTEEQARELARNLTRIGNMAGRKTAAVITDMDQPLGCAVGNAVEVKEAISVLSGETQGDLLELCLTLGSCMLVSAGFAKNDDEARAELMETIRSGKALQKLADLVEAQGGDADAVYEPSMLPDAKVKLEVPSTEAGYVSHINAEEVGLVSMHLGGRATKESTIDLSVGVVLAKKLGDHVEEGESLGTIHASSMEKAQEAAELLRGCYKFSTAPVERPAFIKGIVR